MGEGQEREYDESNRYRNPAKRAAYEHALELVAEHDDGNFEGTMIEIAAILDVTFPGDLSKQDARQVAGKAIRIERGRRLLADAQLVFVQETSECTQEKSE